MTDNIPPGKMAAHYARLLQSRPSETRNATPANEEGLELESYSEPLIGDEPASAGIDPEEVLAKAKENLYKVIENYLGNDAGLKKIADKILTDGGEPLRAVADLDEDYFSGAPQRSADLEVIVQVNGSRPSFLVEKGVPDLASSPIGDWNSLMTPFSASLQKAISCVGRIDKQGQHVGTGFLVGPDLAVTNRHVLQAIAQPGANGTLTVGAGITIDFGKEFQGYGSLNKRTVAKVVFYGDKKIEAPLDHNKLDLALLLLDTATPFAKPVEPLPLKPDGAWAGADTYVYVIGYPGSPGISGQIVYGADVLAQLFNKTFGYKRIAPGGLLGFSASTAPWTLTHDATTLGGNSGSVIVLVGQEFAAAGLHYGGTTDAPRQNWGHNLARTLTQTNASVYAGTLGDCLKKYGCAQDYLH
jgi:V8-like Glu-specific endopeptidase